MGMTSTLIRVNSDYFDHLEVGETYRGEPEEMVYVGKDWESLMFIFGNGFIGAPITGEIFIPINK